MRPLAPRRRNAADSVQTLHPDLIQSLVSTVTEEVTRRLVAALPTLPTPSASVPHEDRQPSSSQAPPDSATTLVNGAITAAHSHITGAPQLLPTSTVASSDTVVSSDTPALMKYGQTIRDLAARGRNWSFYDENFRYLRQTQRSLIPWGSIHGELWLRSQYPNKAPPVNFSNSAHTAGVTTVNC